MLRFGNKNAQVHFCSRTLQVFVLNEIARSIVYKVAGDIHIAFIRRQVSDMLVDFFQFIGIFIIGVFSPQPFLALVVVYNNLGS